MILKDENGNEYEFEYAYNEGDKPYRELGTLKPIDSWPILGDDTWYITDGGLVKSCVYKDYCSTTQIQKLQASGDYYSCLKEIGK